MNKKKIIIITVLIIILLLGIYMLYNTFAINSYISSNNDTYTITLTEDNNTVTVPSNSSKTVYYHIKNPNKGNVKYGVGYTSTNIEVLIYEDSKDNASDIISYGENKYIKLYLKNTSDKEDTVTISTILGYENGGDLIVPTTSTLVTKIYKKPVNFAKYITNLYTSSDKTMITNNSITYNYATSVSLMNDRLGGATSSLDGGNIRYYGANPNNYVYFNCETYPDINCELWRIIGVFDGKVKIMRNSSIGTYTYNSINAINEWSQSDIMKLLNPGYDSESVGGSLYYNSKSGSCYIDPYRTTSCNFTSAGIKNDTTRNMIAKALWNLGGWNTSSVYSNTMYGHEREMIVYSGNSTTWTGKIALAYPSDYGYAADFNTCSGTLINYNTCNSVNWMKTATVGISYTDAYLLTASSNDSSITFCVSYDGIIYNEVTEKSDKVNYAKNVTPVLYLNTNQTISGGDGSSNSPYQLLGN